MVLAYSHIKWGLVSKLLQRAFSWRTWTPGTLKLDSTLFLFKCGTSWYQNRKKFGTVISCFGLLVTILICWHDNCQLQLSRSQLDAGTFPEVFDEFLWQVTVVVSPVKHQWSTGVTAFKSDLPGVCGHGVG